MDEMKLFHGRLGKAILILLWMETRQALPHQRAIGVIKIRAGTSLTKYSVFYTSLEDAIPVNADRIDAHQDIAVFGWRKGHTLASPCIDTTRCHAFLDEIAVSVLQ